VVAKNSGKPLEEPPAPLARRHPFTMPDAIREAFAQASCPVDVGSSSQRGEQLLIRATAFGPAEGCKELAPVSVG